MLSHSIFQALIVCLYVFCRFILEIKKAQKLLLILHYLCVTYYSTCILCSFLLSMKLNNIILSYDNPKKCLVFFGFFYIFSHVENVMINYLSLLVSLSHKRMHATHSFSLCEQNTLFSDLYISENCYLTISRLIFSK